MVRRSSSKLKNISYSVRNEGRRKDAASKGGDKANTLQAKKHLLKQREKSKHLSRGAAGRELRRNMMSNSETTDTSTTAMAGAAQNTVEGGRVTVAAVRTVSRLKNRKRARSELPGQRYYEIPKNSIAPKYRINRGVEKTKKIAKSARSSITVRNTKNRIVNSMERSDTTDSALSGINLTLRATEATVDTVRTGVRTAKGTVSAVRFVRRHYKKRVAAKAAAKTILESQAKQTIIKVIATKATGAVVAAFANPVGLTVIGIAALLIFLIIIMSSFLSMITASMGNVIITDEDTATSYMEQVEMLDIEFANRIEGYKKDSAYDDVSINYFGDRVTVTTNWQEIMAIIAVENIQEVSYTQAEQKRIKECFDMFNKIETRVSTYYCDKDGCNKKHRRLDVFVYSYSLGMVMNEIGFTEDDKAWVKTLAESDLAMIFPGLEPDPEGSDVVPSGKIFSWPVHGKVTSPFGYRIHPILNYKKLHTGIDISAVSKTPVKAAEAGKVTTAGWSDSYGNYIKIDHGGGVITLYAHNTSLMVKKGETVKRGQTIALSGSTGRSTGPHVHFEVRVNNVYQNPLNWL